jgi:hypothetical protein
MGGENFLGREMKNENFSVFLGFSKIAHEIFSVQVGLT